MGAVREPVALLLFASVALASGHGSIEGPLRKADGEPWARAAVHAYRLDGGEPRKRTTESDEKGRYAIADVPPGRYLMAFEQKVVVLTLPTPR